MLSRFIPVARTVANSATRVQAVRCMSGATPAHWKTDREIAVENKATIDDLPVPAGSWQQHYNKRNAKWNMYLIGALLYASFSFFMLINSGTAYLHPTPNLKELQLKKSS